MPNFPATLDTNGAGSLPTNHADGISEIIHASTIDDLATVAVAVETKVGSGASTPTSGLVLTGGSIPGTSTWQTPSSTGGSTTTPVGLTPFSVGPWPQDDSGWTTNLIGHANPTLGIPRAPLLSTMAQNNQLH